MFFLCKPLSHLRRQPQFDSQFQICDLYFLILNPSSFLIFIINAYKIKFLQWLIWWKYFDRQTWESLIPIVGILLTSKTELSYNMFGFCVALFGSCLATSTKIILDESLLHAYILLYHLLCFHWLHHLSFINFFTTLLTFSCIHVFNSNGAYNLTVLFLFNWRGCMTWTSIIGLIVTWLLCHIIIFMSLFEVGV